MEMDKDMVALVAEYKRLDQCMEIMDDDDPVSMDCALSQAAIADQLMDRVVAEWEHQKSDPDAWAEEPLWLTQAVFAVADALRDEWLAEVQQDAIDAATEGNPDYLAHLDEDLDDYDFDDGFGGGPDDFDGVHVPID